MSGVDLGLRVLETVSLHSCVKKPGFRGSASMFKVSTLLQLNMPESYYPDPLKDPKNGTPK